MSNEVYTQLKGELVEYPKSNSNKVLTVIDHIIGRAQENPEKIALRYHDKSITYAQLVEEIINLSHHFLSMGIKRGNFIACYGHRNIDYFIIMLSIFNTGAIYIPLDPFQSSEDLTRVMGQFDNLIVVKTQCLTTEHASKIINLQMKNIKVIDYIPNQKNEDFIGKVEPIRLDEVAYCIFTSGTTGNPKGALVQHLPFLNHNLAKISALNINANDVVSQTATQLFDVHIWQVTSPLMQGATVAILDKCQVEAPRILLNEIAEKKITVLNLVPGIMTILLDEIESSRDPSKLETLKWLLVTGEALPVNNCERWFNYFESAKISSPSIVNAYGPAECGDDVSHMILNSKSDCIAPIAIGKKPIQNVRFLILNDQLQSVPFGEEGVLYLAGDCLGKGYLNNPEKTKEVFLKIQLDGESIEIYNTGDRVRLSERGILYLGRAVNSYIKIDGRRVEINDFTSPLLNHTGIAMAVGVGYEENDKARIGVYVTLKNDFKEQYQNQLSQEEESHIAKIFDDTVNSGSSTQNDEFNHSGWNNYHGQPFSERAVRENIDDALQRILPKITPEANVLEVGCGTGMLAVSVAPKCKTFTGVDISSQSIEIAKRACSQYSNTSFSVCSGQELISKLQPRKFDLIFFNAVVNYIGCPNQLREILKQASNLLTENGEILILDVYHLYFKPAIHYEFEYLKAKRNGSYLSIENLKSNIAMKLNSDPDLFLMPQYFSGLQNTLPQIKSVKCFIKSGEKDDHNWPNPMVRYRYGVSLKTTESKPFPHEITTLSWGNQIQSIDDLISYLSLNIIKAFTLDHVPNIRTHRPQKLITEIKNASNITINQISSLKEFSLTPTAIDPNQISKALGDLGYRVDNIMYDLNDPNYLTFSVTHSKIEDDHYLKLPKEASEKIYSNYPLLNKITQQLTPELYKLLKHLEFANSCTIIIVPNIPFTSNGKVNSRLLLKNYPPESFNNAVEFQGELTPTEFKIAEMIKPYVFVDKTELFCDKSTNFTALGLSSLALTAILAKVNRSFDLNLTFVSIKELGNLQNLAEEVNLQINPIFTSSIKF